MMNKAFETHLSVIDYILHRDQGRQYQHAYFVEKLADMEMIQSMSRKGNSIDNGLMESFFGILESEMFYDREGPYASLEDLKVAIEESIYYYKNTRIKCKLKGITPAQYRNQSLGLPASLNHPRYWVQFKCCLIVIVF